MELLVLVGTPMGAEQVRAVFEAEADRLESGRDFGDESEAE